MSTREVILVEAAKGNPLKTSQLVETLGVSRQTVSGHLRRLVDEGLLVKTGSTRNAEYRLAEPSGVEVSAVAAAETVEATLATEGRFRLRWMPVAIASLVVAVVAVVLLPGREDIAEKGAEAAVESMSAQPSVQVIGAEQTLSVGAVRVEAGSEITLRAGEMVALGDGFRVDEQGALVVEIEDDDKSENSRPVADDADGR